MKQYIFAVSNTGILQVLPEYTVGSTPVGRTWISVSEYACVTHRKNTSFSSFGNF